MSVAVACNLSDGAILGVDSAVAMGTQGGVLKVYENAEKLFQLADQPIGVATYGVATLGMRSIGSFLREFDLKNRQALVKAETFAEIVELLRAFFVECYQQEVIPAVQKAHEKLFPGLPPNALPVLGLVIAGYAPNAHLPEVWNIVVPNHNKPGSAQLSRGQGNFGTNWFALFAPIQRYIKGIDGGMSQELVSFFETTLGRPLSQPERDGMLQILARYEYKIPFPAMPLAEGVEHTRFLVELVINHHRYAIGAPVVGGKVRLGKVSYRGEKFEILDT
jgi:hypothetical protein